MEGDKRIRSFDENTYEQANSQYCMRLNDEEISIYIDKCVHDFYNVIIILTVKSHYQQLFATIK